MFCDLDLSKAISISNEELKKFKKDYKLHMVSNSVISNILSVAKYLDIDLMQNFILKQYCNYKIFLNKHNFAK